MTSTLSIEAFCLNEIILIPLNRLNLVLESDPQPFPSLGFNSIHKPKQECVAEFYKRKLFFLPIYANLWEPIQFLCKYHFTTLFKKPKEGNCYWHVD